MVNAPAIVVDDVTEAHLDTATKQDSRRSGKVSGHFHLAYIQPHERRRPCALAHHFRPRRSAMRRLARHLPSTGEITGHTPCIRRKTALRRSFVALRKRLNYGYQPFTQLPTNFPGSKVGKGYAVMDLEVLKPDPPEFPPYSGGSR